MPTSVHIPRELLKAAERRARELGISRNRLIVDALAKELASSSSWSPGFFEALETLEPGDARAIEETMGVVLAARRSKGPPPL